MNQHSEASEKDVGTKPVIIKQTSSSSIWTRPIGSLINDVWQGRSFLSRFLTGGSVLYCLSAYCILYGIGEILTPLLTKSEAITEALPGILMVNIYELALLGVLVLIVAWRNVTDDAISLIVLVALFLIASGIALATTSHHDPTICLYIGLACVALGVGKLLAMRRFIHFRLGILSFLGLTLILLWNFLATSLMIRPVLAKTATDALKRSQWQLGWLVILTGAVLVLVDAIASRPRRTEQQKERVPLLYTPSMVWIFAIILIAAAGVHQRSITYMLVVDYAFGDFIPIIIICSILLLELMKSMGKQFGAAEVFISILPIGVTAFAILNKSIIAPFQLSLELFWHPPVMLGLTGLAILVLRIRNKWNIFNYIAFVYFLGVVLTFGFSPDKPYNLNWNSCGLVFVAVLFALGILKRNAVICFIAVTLLAFGASQTELLAKFAKAHNLDLAATTAGIAGFGIIAIYLCFGRKLLRLFAVLGSFLAMVSIFDFLSKYTGLWDVTMFFGIAVISISLWLRTKDIITIGILIIPIIRKLYILVKEMSAWGMIVLSFCLLFLGAILSLHKGKKPSQADSKSDPPGAGT